MRQNISQDPFPTYNPRESWEGIGSLPAQWVECPAAHVPFVAAFRLKFQADFTRIVRFHATADERYELYLDGIRVGRGPERGSPDRWYYETYELPITAGAHVLVAHVWAIGEHAPFAQMTAHPGWLFFPDEEEFLPLLATGQADWEAKLLPGYSWQRKEIEQFFVTGDQSIQEGAALAWGFEKGEGDGWQTAYPFDQAVSAATYRLTQAYHQLSPAQLPAMMEVERQLGTVRLAESLDAPEQATRAAESSHHQSAQAAEWQSLLAGQNGFTIPAHSLRRIIIDLENYYCAYPMLTVSGGKGSQVRLSWAESLFMEPQGRTKGNRNEVEGKYFFGIDDTFLPDGSANRCYQLLWWRAGRYLEFFIQTADEPLTVDRFTLRETRYPYEMQSQFAASDPRFAGFFPIAIRALQMCSHETYMDCPYYEQLMYVGDTRLEALVTYLTTADDRLPRKALRTFDASRIHAGLTQSRFPSRIMQIIPPFSLWWVAMVYDFALWRNDPDFVRTLLPGVRSVIEAFLGYRNADGLIQAPQGWNFMDWSAGWHWGVPPDADLGVNGSVNWQMAWVLRQAAALESWVGDPELANRDERSATALAAAIQTALWDEKRGLFADDLAHQHFSEHTQCLAVLSGHLAADQTNQVIDHLLTDADLTRATIYFTHYVFETLCAAGKADAILQRLQLWYDHPSLGMKTTLEAPEPSRSDCHAWGAHPVYHAFATLLGIRPAEFGFQSVRIMPQMGSLTDLSGSLVHPKGNIEVKLQRSGAKLHAEVHLPDGLHGELIYNGKTWSLAPGIQIIES